MTLIIFAIFTLVAIIILAVMFRAQISRINRDTDEKIRILTERNDLLQQQADARQTIAEQKFRILANESLERNSSQLRQSNAEQLNAILSPLRMRLEDFNESVEKSHTAAQASSKSLADQIDRLTRLNYTIGEEARNLASALRGNNRVQGKWGETLLESLLEKGGLKRGLNFDTQVAQDASGVGLRDEEGRGLRPDVVVYLPENRCVIIDSKTSLSAYLEFCETTDREDGAAALKRHTLSIKRHIDGLSAKNYPKTVAHAVEQVLMFIPNDAALVAALDADPSLLEYAMDRKITLVSPSQLSGIILLIAQIWRKENQDRNAAEIARMGGLLYDTVDSFLKDFQAIEKGINATRNAYEGAMQKLTSGQRSIAARAERLKAMGAKTSRSIPPQFISDSFDLTSEISERETADRS